MITKAVVVALFVTMTAYRPIPQQTRPECKSRFQCVTSIDDGVTKFGVAVSQDLLRSGKVHYGDTLYIPGFGYRIVNDTMNSRYTNRVDLMVFSRDEEKLVGERRLMIYKIDVKVGVL